MVNRPKKIGTAGETALVKLLRNSFGFPELRARRVTLSGRFDLGDVLSSDKSWSYRVVGKIKGGDTPTDYADNFRGAIAPSLLYEPV